MLSSSSQRVIWFFHKFFFCSSPSYTFILHIHCIIHSLSSHPLHQKIFFVLHEILSKISTYQLYSCLLATTREAPANAGDIKRREFGPWVGKTLEENGSPSQCSCLENLMERGACQAAVHRVTKSQAWLKQFSMPSPLDILDTIFSCLD